MTVGQIRKAIAATLVALATWGVTAGLDDSYEDVEWWGLLGALVAAAAVYLIPNDPPPPEPDVRIVDPPL
jgi:hypothetical protein